jgi:hypothetical protein
MAHLCAALSGRESKDAAANADQIAIMIARGEEKTDGVP